MRFIFLEQIYSQFIQQKQGKRNYSKKKEAEFKKIVSCAKKSEKSPHALQKANMRAFYAKQNTILAQSYINVEVFLL